MPRLSLSNHPMTTRATHDPTTRTARIRRTGHWSNAAVSSRLPHSTDAGAVPWDECAPAHTRSSSVVVVIGARSRIRKRYESERVVGGSRAHVTGCADQTLDGHFEQARCITRCGNGSTRAMSSSARMLSSRRRRQAHGCCEPASGCSAARTSCASTARSARPRGSRCVRRRNARPARDSDRRGH